MNKKVIILDGARESDKDLDSILTLLIDVLQHQYKAKTKIFTLRNIKINHCIGCFNCFFKTPGRCIHTDAGTDILQAIVNSNTVIFFTPIVFGGYSSELKKIIDRFLPVALPFFRKSHGETHHPPRYSTFPHIVGIGVHPAPDKKQEECFKILVGRNALNLPPSHYSAEVISSTKGSSEKLRNLFHALLSRTDKLPLRNTLSALVHKSSSIPKIPTGKRKALLIIGSPKKKHSSTSTVLGSYLLNILQQQNIETESLTLDESLMHCKAQHDLCLAVERADIILLACPLYVDSLPFLATKALEVISLHRKNVPTRDPKIILPIINSAFEPYQNRVALAICQNFASESGMLWAGGLAMGAGEALISGNSLTGFKGFRDSIRPPLFYVTRSLKATARALAKGEPVHENTVRLLAKKPAPLISSNVWHSLFIKAANRLIKKEAVSNGLTMQEIFEAPLAK
ncbi:MAG: NAD(P)H-dependent oxidoreductase [Candidatus Electrothrix communis]|nr:MAG: NAD(P)H-dependent oxidoreductase [Candidatus Electrothrix communis]